MYHPGARTGVRTNVVFKGEARDSTLSPYTRLTRPDRRLTLS